MTDKKRKSLPTGSELPKKKTKVSIDEHPNLKEVKAKHDSSTNSQDAATSKRSTRPASYGPGSKKARKRAADFMSDDDDEAPEVSSSKEAQTSGNTKAGKAAHEREKRKKKKAKKAMKDGPGGAETLTADGVNGITENKESAKAKTTTAKTPAAKSMQAEAQRTADQELEDGWGGFGEDEDAAKEASGEGENKEEENGAHLMAGFDSDSSDKEDKDYDGNIPGVSKKGRKLLNAVKDKKLDNETGVVYLGRIPHGFYEAEMRGYLGQYGDITRLRLSRNKRTGASKHFAFVEFASNEVAKIVAEANNNYMMFGHRLKCSVVADPSKLHEDLWKGANKKFRRIPHEKIQREKLAAPKSVEEWEKKNQREQKKRDKKAKDLKETMGYGMPEIKLKGPKEALEEAKMVEQKSDETVKPIEDRAPEPSEQPAKSIEAAKETPIEPLTEPQHAAAARSGDVKADVAEAVTETKEPEAAAEGDVQAVEDSSNMSKVERKALKRAKKAKAKAEDAQTNGSASNAEVDTVSEPKQDPTPPADNKPSNDAKSSDKAKADKDSQSPQQKPKVKYVLPIGSDVQKEHKKDEKPKGEGKQAERTKKHHELKNQRLAEESNNAVVADKKEKKIKKKSKSAA